jgi:RNA recognition motif-containing protein
MVGAEFSGLTENTTESQVAQLFDDFGEVSRVDMKKGFAFIHFHNQQGMQGSVNHS